MHLRRIDVLIKEAQKPIEDRQLRDFQLMLEGRTEVYYHFLYLLVKEMKPAVCLEIGVNNGTGSLHMVHAAKEYDGVVIGIDKKYKLFPDRHISIESPHHYRYIRDDSLCFETQNQVKKIVKEHGSIGLVYQDSSHHYQASIDEWNAYSRFLSQNAVWICDDITPAFHDPKVDPPGKGMVQYFDWLPGSKKLYKDVLHKGSTQGIVVL